MVAVGGPISGAGATTAGAGVLAAGVTVGGLTDVVFEEAAPGATATDWASSMLT
jgi:hypothetical protein